MIDWVTIAVKALVYATCLAAGGGTLFLVILGAQLSQSERVRTVALARGLAVVGIYVSIALILMLGARLGDEWSGAWDKDIIQIVLDGHEGRAFALRAFGLVLIAGALFADAWARGIALLGAVAVAVSFGLTGHAGSAGRATTAIVSIHLIAVSYWIGALRPLYRLTWTAELPRLGAILERFGTFAVGFVGALVLAGLALIWWLLGSLEVLFTSSYGQLLVLKLAFVGTLLLLAAINKLRLTPGILAGEAEALLYLRRSIAVEIALVNAILIVTAIFTTLVGPPEAPGAM